MIKILSLVAIVIAVLSSLAIFSGSITGLYSKAYTVMLNPDENYQRNITVRKYYNLTVRFRYVPTGSDISFDDEDAMIILKDINGNGLMTFRSIEDGKIYQKMDKMDLDRISTIDAQNVGSFGDVVDQAVNITFYGTKAYLTIIVEKKGGTATVSGLILDDLTDEPLEGVGVVAFEKGLDPLTDQHTASSASSAEGYSLILPTEAGGKSYDIYVTDYKTV